ncbi:hypothetical protein TNCV_3423081 [Trichonephila clavipes]|nr:hypothetical protein TNCV_3423081 [Trichonephila clavipes]
MSRLDGQFEARPQCLSPQASLVLIYRPTAVGMKAESTLLSVGLWPVVWKHDTLPLDHWAKNTNRRTIFCTFRFSMQN